MYIEYAQDISFKRPVIKLEQMKGIRMLIDSGAVYSVWTFSEDLLKEIGGVDQHHIVPFGGYGGATQGKLYTLDLWLDKSLLLKNLPVIVEENLKLNCELILSITALDEFEYRGWKKEQRFSLDTHSNQVVYPFAYKIKPSGSISVFVQDESPANSTTDLP